MSTKSQSRWFADLIHEEGMEDPGQFLRTGFFDEIPFFSRYDQLPAPDPGGRREADRLLLGSCLDYLENLISIGPPSIPLFAAITVIKERRDQPIVPSLFVGCGIEPVKTILGGLSLTRPRSSFAAYLEDLLKDLGEIPHYGLLQDSTTVPGRPRLFLLKRNSLYPSLIGFDRLRVPSGRRNVDPLSSQSPKRRGS